MAAAAPTNGGVLGDFCSHISALFLPRRARARLAATAAAARPVPLLVCALAGNPLTGAAILACLNTADARQLRRLHPAVPAVVAGVPWCDTDIRVVDAVRWRAGLPAAVGVRLADQAMERKLWRLPGSGGAAPPWAAALGSITRLDLRACAEVTDKLLLHLPASLHTLNVRSCRNLTPAASVAHLTALTTLDCSWTAVVSHRADGLPASLQELCMLWAPGMSNGVSLAHLSQLRVLRAGWSGLGIVMLASLQPSVVELHASGCKGLTPEAAFAHLMALRFLDVAECAISNGSLATVPPCLVFLNARKCKNLNLAAALPHLPALRVLDVSGTDIGDALVASLPPSLVEARLAGCSSVTAGASLDQLRALRLLHCIDAGLAPATLAACRASGCAVRAAGVLRGHETYVTALTLLSDGRLASCDNGGKVRLWDVTATGGEVGAALGVRGVRALAALRDGGRLAIGTASWDGKQGCIKVWDVGGAPPVRRATIDCHTGVWALAVLADGRLAAGCDDGTVKIVDVDAGVVMMALAGHTGGVTMLAVLPDGTLASGSADTTVRVWDVSARVPIPVCVATLGGHSGEVSLLAVLRDGRLVSKAIDDAVWLWDVATRTCVVVLTGHNDTVAALAALPDGRLASGSWDGVIQVWDTRPAAATDATRAAGAVPVEVVGLLDARVGVLLPLPDGRLACASRTAATAGGTVYLLDLPPTSTALR